MTDLFCVSGTSPTKVQLIEYPAHPRGIDFPFLYPTSPCQHAERHGDGYVL